MGLGTMRNSKQLDLRNIHSDNHSVSTVESAGPSTFKGENDEDILALIQSADPVDLQ